MKKLFDQILGALRANGGKGMIIDEITSLLDIDTQTAADAIEKLLKEKRIKMEDARILLQQDDMGDEAEQGKMGDVSTCPCYHCLKISRCGIRQPDSPAKCKEMQTWIATSESS